MKNIGFIVKYGIPAIWNCIKQHVRLIDACNCNIFLYIEENEDVSIIQEEYRDKIRIYSSYSELMKFIKSDSVELLWVPTALAVWRIAFIAKSNKLSILFWVQGSIPDESYMRNKSFMRKWGLRIIEKIAFKISNGFIFVSDTMAFFYKQKYRFSKPYAVIPCISEFSNVILEDVERISNSFVYIGGMSKWQCFEETVNLYLKYSKSDSIFHVITHEVTYAQKIIDQLAPKHNEIKIYSISDRTQIPRILSQFQYGFLIREESPVNFVASPIKFLEYISCGVNVIMTDAVPFYAKIVNEYKIGTVIDISGNNILNEYNYQTQNVYNKLFSTNVFVKKYEEILSKI